MCQQNTVIKSCSTNNRTDELEKNINKKRRKENNEKKENKKNEEKKLARKKNYKGHVGAKSALLNTQWLGAGG